VKTCELTSSIFASNKKTSEIDGYENKNKSVVATEMDT
jgi:hypothetical protein